VEHAGTQTKSTRRVSDPHSFEITDTRRDCFHSAARHRLAIGDCHEECSKRRTKIVVVGRDTQRWIEALLEATIDLGEILLDAPTRLRARRIDALYSRSESWQSIRTPVDLLG
jgi:hypothetical protein